MQVKWPTFYFKEYIFKPQILDLEKDIFSSSRTDILNEYDKVDLILRYIVPIDFLNNNYSIEYIAYHAVVSSSKGNEGDMGKSLIRYSFNETIVEFNLDSYSTMYRYNNLLIFLQELLEDIVSQGTGRISSIVRIEKKSTIFMILTNEKGDQHTLLLENISYIRALYRNLILFYLLQ